MSDHERDVLHNEILVNRPKLVVESGCWFGGGSTFQIAAALKKNAHSGSPGQLHTCDPNIDHWRSAHDYYHQPFWSGQVAVHNCSFEHMLRWSGVSGKPDFIMLDGGEEPEAALADLKLVEKIIDQGAIFCMHDWLNPESHKQDHIKPYLESSPNWHIYGLLQPPYSVGLVLARYLG